LPESVLGAAHPDTTVEAFEKNARQRYGEMSGAFLKIYPAGSNAQAGLSQNDSARDQMRTSMYLWVLNRAKTAKTKAYTYYWITRFLDHSDKYGAFHTSEVPYVFNSLVKSDRPFADDQSGSRPCSKQRSELRKPDDAEGAEFGGRKRPRVTMGK